VALGRTRGTALPIELLAGQITSLVAKGGQGDRVAVYLDGRSAFDLAAVIVGEAGLRRGDMLGPDRQAVLLQDDAPFRARHVALGMVSRREYCRGEIRVKLRQAGFGEEIVAQTISWLEERDYLNDSRFASAFAAGRLKAGWGSRQIVGELLKKGVGRDIAEGFECLGASNASGVADETEMVVALARKRFGGQLALDPAGAKRRLAGFLARRGHDWDTIQSVTRILCEETGCPEAPEFGTAGGTGQQSLD
jgi:regulatory protein